MLPVTGTPTAGRLRGLVVRRSQKAVSVGLVTWGERGDPQISGTSRRGVVAGAFQYRSTSRRANITPSHFKNSKDLV